MLESYLSWAGWECKPLSADGAAVWALDGMPPAGVLPVAQRTGRLAVLFCRGGGLSLELSVGRLDLWPGQALVFPGRAGGCRCRFSQERFQGVLVSEEEGDALEALTALCPGLSCTPPDGQPGCTIVEAVLWGEALFVTLDRLPEQWQGSYCAIKTLELLYLLYTGGNAFVQPLGDSYYDRYQLQAVQSVHDYMLEHLDQHLTIPQLADRFRISGTMLKACFRQLYGAPIHQYLLERRMVRAAQLLSATGQTVVQVAAAVGYSSVSQFGIAFKVRYQMSPAQYRREMKKMSVSVRSGPKQDEKSN